MTTKKQELKRLQALWNTKLSESGFDDIEYRDGSLKAGHPRSVYTLDPILIAAKQEYYCLCENFLHENRFRSNLEKVIWEYHTNAISARDIAKILADTKVRKMGKSTVHKIIQRLETKMKVKYLLP